MTTEFDLSTTQYAHQHKAQHWVDWEIARHTAYLADLKSAKKSLKSRPNDKANAFTNKQLSAAIETVEALLAKSKAAQPGLEAARSKLLDACAANTDSFERARNATTVEEQLTANAENQLHCKLQAVAWNEFYKTATESRLPLTESAPLHYARQVHRADNITQELVEASFKAPSERAKNREFGCMNLEYALVKGCAKSIVEREDIGPLVWLIVESTHKDYKGKDIQDSFDLMFCETLRLAKMDHDRPRVWAEAEAEAAE